MQTFEDRVAIVTGGASGIGLAVSRAFVAQGTAVVIASRSVERGERVATELVSAGGRATFVPTDVAESSAVRDLVDAAVGTYGRLDVLVNNSGVEVAEGLDGPSEEDWDDLFAVNTRGTWLGCRFALPHLLKSQGAIVNNASVAALIGSPGSAAYAASKAAVVSLTRSLALAYADQGVRINAICPGPILTDMTYLDWEAAGGEEVGRRQNLARCPARRMAEPEEVASLVLYLASPEASFVTGAAIPVDGGKAAGVMLLDRYRW